MLFYLLYGYKKENLDNYSPEYFETLISEYTLFNSYLISFSMLFWLIILKQHTIYINENINVMVSFLKFPLPKSQNNTETHLGPWAICQFICIFPIIILFLIFKRQCHRHSVAN